jgi:hypothetical protein
MAPEDIGVRDIRKAALLTKLTCPPKEAFGFPGLSAGNFLAMLAGLD